MRNLLLCWVWVLASCVGRSGLVAREAGDDRRSPAGTACQEDSDCADVCINGFCTPQQVSLTVEPAYPVHGANWNSYVANDGADVWSASDTACGGTGGGFDQCLHGGEIRKVALPGVSFCAGLALTDTRNAFLWTCVLESGVASFYSTGLQLNTGLRELIDADGFEPNAVSLDGPVRGTSTPAVWWSNPVVPLPDNSLSSDAAIRLDSTADGGNDAAYQPGTIFTLSTTRATSGYNLNLDELALVTLPGAALRYNGNTDRNYDTDTGEGVTSLNERCVIGAGSQSYLWLEADVHGARMDGTGLCLHAIGFSRVVNSRVRFTSDNSGWGAGVVLTSVESSRFEHLTVDDCRKGLKAGLSTDRIFDSYFGDIRVSNSGDQYNPAFDVEGRDNLFVDLRIANNPASGLRTGHYENVFHRVRVYNNEFEGVRVTSPSVFVDVVTANNRYAGFVLSNHYLGSAESSVVGLVSAFNGSPNMLKQVGHTTTNNVVLVGSSSDGLRVENVVGSAWSNVAVTDSGDNDIEIATTPPELLQGLLLVTGDGSCAAGVGTGLADGTCQNEGSSNATVIYSGSVLGDFVGAINRPDGANGSADDLGQAMHPGTSDFDWFAFDNDYRMWGSWNVPGRWSAGIGSILDFELLATSTHLFERTGDGAARNDAFVANAPCPAAVDGADGAMLARSWDDSRYLRNAREIVAPMDQGYVRAGNHNGLCETGESCLYMPNLGVYQGHGTQETCWFNDGPHVSGVVMHGYPGNGR